MRFSEFRLLRYGNFENRILSFSAATPDFHMIFGPNEAGKSTTLEAVNDFLFGFPHAKTQDYRFEAPLLLLGAALEEGDQKLSLQRKRGRLGSLRDDNDEPVDEGILAGLLRGQTRDSFRLSWSLDHHRLRQGGESIVDAKDDVGQTIFAAGAGLSRVAEVIAVLDDEANKIWGKRAAIGRAYTSAEREYEDAVKREREAEVRPRAWVAAKAKLDELTAEGDKLEALRKALSQQQRHLERIRRVAADARRWENLQSATAESESPLFSESEEALADSAMAAMAAALQKRVEAERLIAKAQADLTDHAIDHAVLKHDAEISALVEQRGAISKALQDRAELENELRAKREQLGTRLAAAGEMAATLAALPPRDVVIQLRALAKKNDEQAAAEQALIGTRIELAAKRNRIAAELAAIADVAGYERLKAAVMTARGQADSDAALRKEAALLRDTEGRRAEAFEKLQPWSGDDTALRALAPLPDAEIMAAERAHDRNAQLIAGEQREVSKLGEQLAQAQLQRTQLSVSGSAISAAVLSNTRRERDQTWSGIRDFLRAAAPLADAAAVATLFEQNMMAADQAADTRFATAEASAKLAAADESVARRRLELAQAEERLGILQNELATAALTWRQKLADAGLPEVEMAALRDWLKRREIALVEAEKCAQAQLQFDLQQASTAQLAADLQAAMAAAGAIIEAGSTSFAVRLQAAELALAGIEERIATGRQLQSKLREADEELERASAKLVDQRGKTLVAAQEWQTALAALGLCHLRDISQLDLYDDLRNEQAAATVLERRIQDIILAEQVFIAEIAAVTVALGGYPGQGNYGDELGHLQQRLKNAKDLQLLLQDRQRTLAERRGECRAAEADCAAALGLLAPLLAKTGLPDSAALADAIARSRAARKRRDEKDTLERRIVQQGDGYPLATLLADCAAADPDRLVADSDSVQAELDDLAKRMSDNADARGEARKTLAGLNRGADAAQAAAEAAWARSEMEVQAETYMLRRAEAVVLKWAMERHRREFQNPLLARAKILFKTLTLGRYVDLEVDDGRERERVLGVCEGRARVVPVETMSDGTVDQLYLSLRLAALEHSVHAGVVLPFLADDLFINFDDERSRAGLQVLAEVAKSTQVIFFTHNRHLVDIARDTFGADKLHICELGSS